MKNLLYLLLGFVVAASIVFFSCWDNQDSADTKVIQQRLSTYQAYEEALK